MNKKRGFGDNLPSHMKGQFKNPDIQAKAQATNKRKREEKQARKDAAKSGFGLSMASDPKEQAKLIDRLWVMALADDLELSKWSIRMLNDMGVIKQPAEKPEEAEIKAEKKINPKSSVELLKRKAKEAKEMNYDSDEDAPSGHSV